MDIDLKIKMYSFFKCEYVLDKLIRSVLEEMFPMRNNLKIIVVSDSVLIYLYNFRYYIGV